MLGQDEIPDIDEAVLVVYKETEKKEMMEWRWRYNQDSQTAMCKTVNDRTSDSGERIRIEEMEKANESS